MKVVHEREEQHWKSFRDHRYVWDGDEELRARKESENGNDVLKQEREQAQGFLLVQGHLEWMEEGSWELDK